MNYTPGCLRRFCMGGLDNGMYVVAAIATKTSASTGDKVPQQGYYLGAWQQPEPPVAPAGRKHSTGLLRMISDGYKSTRPMRHAVVRSAQKLMGRSPLMRMGLKEDERY